MEISIKYEPLFALVYGHHKEVDTVICTGGRLSGKSFGVGRCASEAFIQKDWKVLYSRFTNMSIKDSIYGEFVRQLEDSEYINNATILNDRVKSNVGDGEVVFKGIKTGSGNQTANLKSLTGFNCFIVDEAEEIPDKETFKKVFYSIRSKDKRNLSILILNPTTKEHWIYKEYYEKKNIPDGFCGIVDNVLYIHTTYLDVNPEFVPDNIRNDYEVMKRESPDEYNQIVMGGWLSESKGKLYNRNDFKQFSLNGFKKENVQHCLGHIDVAVQGNDFLAFPIINIIDRQIYVVDVLFSDLDTGYTIPASKEKILEHKPQHVWIENNGAGYIFATSLQNANSSTSIIDYHQSANKHAKIISKAGFIKKFVHFRNDYEAGSDYDLFMRQILQYSKDPKENKNIHDDAIDSLSSLIDFTQKYLLGNWD